MPAVVPGTRYWGKVDGVLTEAVFVAKKQNTTLEGRPTFYVLAVPCEGDEERAQPVRAALGEHAMHARLIALPRVNGMGLKDPANMHLYTRWAAPPRLDDLEALLGLRAALPVALVQGSAQVQFSEVESGAESPAEPDEFDTANLFADPPRATFSELEPPRPRTATTAPRPTNVFDDLMADFQDVRRAVPPMPHAAPRLPVRAPEASLPAAGGPPPDFYAAMVNALDAIADRVSSGHASSTGISTAQASLFKLQGARGRVAQDELDRLFDAAPEGVVTAFEEAVMRRAGGLASASRVGGLSAEPHGSSRQPQAPALLLGAWRETVPARDHATIARVGEAIIDAYRSIREGQPQRGAARLALLIGAMEQACLDGGRWGPRAQHLSGMPPVPLQVYTALPAEEKKAQDKDPTKVGAVARLADPMRATTALAVFKDDGSA